MIRSGTAGALGVCAGTAGPLPGKCWRIGRAQCERLWAPGDREFAALSAGLGREADETDDRESAAEEAR